VPSLRNRHIFVKVSAGPNIEPSGTVISASKDIRSQSTLVAVGIGVLVGVNVGVAVGVNVLVGVLDAVIVGVAVSVGVLLGVKVLVAV